MAAPDIASSPPRTIARWALGGALAFAGISHLFWARKEFQAQVPDWTTEYTPLDKDAVVVASGAVEIMLGAALIALPRERSRIGLLLAAFFVAVFPGNIEQYAKKRDGFGLDTDRKRLVRLFFQPALVAWAYWSTRSR
ncbi:MauE/DoxX family redox-associated membrane protein [Microbacterium sp. CJ77]|uniref:DoxX family protein n=1 Tax=Microbacterium sp. CJ77 TaxID=2079201 RepID=UPI0015E1AC94|nr:MauE/DoxX family redox-associated membrane protein [Microbacterium sp. CJ77]